MLFVGVNVHRSGSLNFWGYTIDRPLEWAAVILLVAIGLALYFSIVWFVQKYATGIVGGLILMGAGLGLILGPAFYLMSNNAPLSHMILSTAAIFAGCVSVLVGAFSVRDYEDF